MSVVAMVPSQNRTVVVETDDDVLVLRDIERTLEYIDEVLSGNGTELLGILGGPAQNLFVRASQLGIKTHRIPWPQLFEMTGLTAGSEPEDRASALRRAWQTDPDAFYQTAEIDERIFLVRELTRVRLAIQDTYRKPAQLQYQAAFRDVEPLLPDGARYAKLRQTMAEPKMIEGALEDEHQLELRIKNLVEGLPIWEALHPEEDDVLPRVKGLGPSLGGSLIGEIGDIRRFASADNLRAYARFHVNPEGNFPHRKKGEVANWNQYLNRAVWLWSTDQLARYPDHVWRKLYDWKKAMECQAHPEAITETFTRDGQERTRTRFTLGHIDKRAKRWVGSQLLMYIFDLWWAIERGEDSERWYRQSTWPTFFQRVQTELDDGLQEFLGEQIATRRKEVPEED